MVEPCRQVVSCGSRGITDTQNPFAGSHLLGMPALTCCLRWLAGLLNKAGIWHMQAQLLLQHFKPEACIMHGLAIDIHLHNARSIKVKLCMFALHAAAVPAVQACLNWQPNQEIRCSTVPPNANLIKIIKNS